MCVSGRCSRCREAAAEKRDQELERRAAAREKAVADLSDTDRELLEALGRLRLKGLV